MTSPVTVQPFQLFMTNAPARLLQNNGNINALRTNALLRDDEWTQLDEAIVDVTSERLRGIADLRSRGLTQPLGGLGTLLSEYEQQGDMSPADVDMAGVSAGEEDTVTFTLVGVPVPIVHKDYRINIRRLLASRTRGDALDTTQAEVAARKVAEELEDILFNGEPITVGGNTIRGYTDHPSRNTGSAAGDWGTIGNVYTTILNMISDAEADGYFGPYGVYAARTQYSEAREVFTDGSGQTAVQRVMENLDEIEFFEPSDRLTAGEVVLVTLVRDVADVAVAQDVTNVEWETEGGMISHFKVMSAIVPRIKDTSEGDSGIVHYTGA